MDVDKIVYDTGKFPNGMPRATENGLTDIDGIQYIFYAGAEHPIWSDEQLTVDARHAAFFHKWKQPQAWCDGLAIPLVERSISSYENTNQEAYDLARSVQRDLESRGEFVPIYIRW